MKFAVVDEIDKLTIIDANTKEEALKKYVSEFDGVADVKIAPLNADNLFSSTEVFDGEMELGFGTEAGTIFAIGKAPEESLDDEDYYDSDENISDFLDDATRFTLQ